MSAPTLTPAALDQAAARILDEHGTGEAWAGITAGWDRTAPAAPAARRLLTKTVDELVTEALGAINPHGTRPPVDVRLPGRLARALPDWAHRHRADLSHLPSTQLYVAATILREWGWQQRPHHMRNWRGQRCICGAIITAVHLGVGTEAAAGQAAWHVLSELKGRGWGALIGDWNQAPGRTAEQAFDVVMGAYRRAAAAEQ
ncbi:MAG TPA: hypothetical protein DEQ61_09795 [Streptomyces sp.]|nr:hypothetical protein [Streptomyces sp.]